MKQLRNYINIKKAPSTIKVGNGNIFDIVTSELDRLGYDAELNHIDTSKVTDMSMLFDGNITGKRVNTSRVLNPDISKWDVSNVTKMDYMFQWCKKFNCDISEWDVSNVTSMNYMFKGCLKFNQPIGSWNVSKVTSMNSIFFKCENFYQDLSSWTPDCRSIDYRMFDGCPIKKEWKPQFKKV